MYPVIRQTFEDFINIVIDKWHQSNTQRRNKCYRMGQVENLEIEKCEGAGEPRGGDVFCIGRSKRELICSWNAQKRNGECRSFCKTSGQTRMMK
jgi:hypothetical protein